MNKLLLIMGDIAAGKSTFAHILSRRYDTNVFTKDTIKEVLGDTVGFANREENLKLSKATIELMMFIFAEFAKLNKNLILESNFHRAELERISTIASANNYEVLILVLRGDVEILHKRFVNRIQNENRHSVHKSINLNALEDFKNVIDRSRAEEIRGNVIMVNADDFSYQTDEVLLAKIDKFME